MQYITVCIVIRDLTCYHKVMRQLRDLVEIRTGYTFRSSIDTFSEGDTEVIQAKDLGVDYGFALRPKVLFTGGDKHLLQPGDVLVSARGFSKAQLFKEPNKKAVAASSVFVLTPKSNGASSEFIAMFFNSVPGIKAMLELSSGGSVRSITKESIGQIIIPEIPLDKQRSLGKAVQAIDDYRALIAKKELYLDHIRTTIISKTLKEAAK